jgi:hypothetical protein
MISQVIQVQGYKVSETETLRTQDLRRFLVAKPRSDVHYVVTFHTSGCSCPAGRSQKRCKHVAMVRSICS